MRLVPHHPGDPRTVRNSWTATLCQSGSTLAAAGVDWNKILAAGATTQFGFCANR
jgi:endoglucanase